jgi:hypothetical protein
MLLDKVEDKDYLHISMNLQKDRFLKLYTVVIKGLLKKTPKCLILILRSLNYFLNHLKIYFYKVPIVLKQIELNNISEEFRTPQSSTLNP